MLGSSENAQKQTQTRAFFFTCGDAVASESCTVEIMRSQAVSAGSVTASAFSAGSVTALTVSTGSGAASTVSAGSVTASADAGLLGQLTCLCSWEPHVRQPVYPDSPAAGSFLLSTCHPAIYSCVTIGRLCVGHLGADQKH